MNILCYFSKHPSRFQIYSLQFQKSAILTTKMSTFTYSTEYLGACCVIRKDSPTSFDYVYVSIMPADLEKSFNEAKTQIHECGDIALINGKLFDTRKFIRMSRNLHFSYNEPVPEHIHGAIYFMGDHIYDEVNAKKFVYSDDMYIIDQNIANKIFERKFPNIPKTAELTAKFLDIAGTKWPIETVKLAIKTYLSLENVDFAVEYRDGFISVCKNTDIKISLKLMDEILRNNTFTKYSVEYAGNCTFITNDESKEYVIVKGRISEAHCLAEKFEEAKNGIHYCGRNVIINGRMLNVRKFLAMAKLKFYSPREIMPALMDVRVDNTYIYNGYHHVGNINFAYFTRDDAIAHLNMEHKKRIKDIKIYDEKIEINGEKYEAADVKNALFWKLGLQYVMMSTDGKMINVNKTHQISGLYLLEALKEIHQTNTKCDKQIPETPTEIANITECTSEIVIPDCSGDVTKSPDVACVMSTGSFSLSTFTDGTYKINIPKLEVGCEFGIIRAVNPELIVAVNDKKFEIKYENILYGYTVNPGVYMINYGKPLYLVCLKQNPEDIYAHIKKMIEPAVGTA